MPYARRARQPRRRPKRTVRRRRWNTSKATGRQLAGPIVNFMPNSCMRKMRYVTGITLNPAVSNKAAHVFTANGLYDPDITGTGNQPRGFDQIMAAYQKYTVVGSKISITQTTAVTGGNGYLYLTHSRQTNPMSAEPLTEAAFENSSIVKKPLILADNSGNMRKVKVTGQVGCKKFFKQNIMQEDDYSGSASANPTEQSYWTVYYQHVNGSDPDSMHFLVEIEYIAVFRDPAQIGQS